jgi:mono/diheme cytochrome c family protein
MRTRAFAVALVFAAGFHVAWLRAARPAPPAPVTFSETIAPIVYANCVGCHRPGEAAPFSLVTYEDVAKRAPLIAKVTASRYMPPWHAAHGYGEFADERRLSDDQIAAFAAWAKAGMPKGDLGTLAKPPTFPDGWQLGKPDLILEMPDAFSVPASGPDIYRNFAIPTGLTEDRYVRAVEYRPGTRKVVHHALFSFIKGGVRGPVGKDGQPGFPGAMPVALVPAYQPAGDLGAWAVGNTPRFLPEGLAWTMTKASDFVLQLHLHPTGKPETERSTIGLYFAEKPPEMAIVEPGIPGLFGALKGIDIPAGERAYTITGTYTTPANMKAFSVLAHAHYLGKEFKATATLPDGSTRPLLWIQDWDFNWQDRYDYKQPVLLPKGTKVDVTISFDNSADNPHNPCNPPRRVKWGLQSFDEMGGIKFLMVPVTPADQEALLQQRRAIAAGIQKAVGDMKEKAAKEPPKPPEEPLETSAGCTGAK